MSLRLLIIFGISLVEWFIAGKKGLCLLNGSKWFIFWACVEVALAFLSLQTWFSGDTTERVWMAVVAVVGCALGCWFSGVVRKR